MKPLFITAVVSNSGKTALALGLGLKLKSVGYTVGYFKPISTQPSYLNGKLVDEDAEFVRRTLGLSTPAAELASVIIDDSLFEALIENKGTRDFRDEIKSAYAHLSADKDVLLVEGGASMREGYAIGLSTIAVADMLELPTLGVVRYRDGLKVLDDALALRYRMAGRLLGIIINGVPAEALDQVKDKAAKYLESQGVRVYGVLPHRPTLASISVGELIDTLHARVLSKESHSEAIIDNLSVGAMSAESALPRMRQLVNKAVITGGDRADIQAAALATSTTALILTGNLQPDAEIVARADALGVAVLLVPNNTIETVEMAQKVFGKTRLGQPVELVSFRALVDTDVDTARLFADLGL